MHRHCGTNNRAPQWTFTDPCKPEVRLRAERFSQISLGLRALVIESDLFLFLLASLQKSISAYKDKMKSNL